VTSERQTMAIGERLIEAIESVKGGEESATFTVVTNLPPDAFSGDVIHLTDRHHQEMVVTVEWVKT
jgi:hypothetical protein